MKQREGEINEEHTLSEPKIVGTFCKKCCRLALLYYILYLIESDND